MKFVTNSSPLIFLAKSNALHLLQKHHILIPEAVRTELLAKESVEGDRLKNFFENKSIEFIKVKKKRQLSATLGKGEMEVINVALEQKISAVLLDDRRARSLARVHHLITKGTLWIIVHAYKKKIISKKETKQLIFKLPSHGFRIDEKFLMKVLEELG